MINIEQIEIVYKQTVAVSSVDLQIPEGKIYAIIGPSGCGKTSLLMAVAGLVEPQRGSIRIEGCPVRGVLPQVGIVLQRPGLFPWKTILDNVALGLLGLGEKGKPALSLKQIHERAEHYLALLGIADQRNKYPQELSGGELQRAAIARAIVREPRVLLLDEGASALDEITREKLQDLIIEIQASRSLTVMAATHSISEAVYLGDQVVVMNRGRIHELLLNTVATRSRSSAAFYAMNTRVREALNRAVEGSK